MSSGIKCIFDMRIVKGVASMRWSLLVLYLPLLWLIAISNAQQGCFTDQFTFATRSACDENNCPGACVGDYDCCVDDCFRIPDFAIQSTCKFGNVDKNETDEVKCRALLQEIDCVANFSGSTFDICYLQVVDMIQHEEVTIKGVDPVNCPCQESYTKLQGICAHACETDACYNTTNGWTGDPICCVNNNTLPLDSDCRTDEERIPSVISLTFDLCNEQCAHTCRESGFGRLPVCCRSIPKPEVKPKDDGKGVGAGIIALIVIMIIFFIVVLLLITVWYIRRRARATKYDVN